MNIIRAGIISINLIFFLSACAAIETRATPSPFQPVTLMGWNPPSITYRDYYQSAIPNESFYTTSDPLGWGRPATGMYGL